MRRLWWHPTAVPTIFLFLHTAVWLATLVLTGDAVFQSHVLLNVVSVSSKEFWITLCSVGPLLVILGQLPTPYAYVLRLIGWLTVLFWWSFTAAVLLRVAPLSFSDGDCTVSSICAFWIFVRQCQRYRPV